MIIRSRVPLRIGFFGGGTDVPPYSYEHGGKVLTAAINKYAYTTWQVSDSSDLSFHSHDLNLNTKVEDLVYDGKYDLIKATFKYLNLNKGGHFTLHSDAPVGSGLGTSSAVTVSLVGAIWDGIGKTAEKPFTLAKTRKEIADTAFKIEREELGIAGGFQDQYVATFGGFNIIEMDKNKNVIVIPLKISKDIQSELQYSILLCDIKSTRMSGNIIAGQMKEYSEGKNLEVHHKLKELVTPGMNALLNGDIKHFGELLHESWSTKKEISKGTSNDYIDALYNAARESGAVYGGKITGAGGGGHMVLICDPTRKVEVQKAVIKKALEFSAGTENISNLVDFKTVSFDDKGLYVWRV